MRKHWPILVLLAIFAGCMIWGAVQASAAPLKVYVHQDSLDPGAEVRVYTKVKGPGVATIQVETLDTRLGNWATEGPATVKHVSLHKGLNRVHSTLSVQRLEGRFCAWQVAHPECPYLTDFRHPYLRVPVPFDRVLVTVTTERSSP